MNQFASRTLALGLLSFVACRAQGPGSAALQDEDAGAIADARLGRLTAPDAPGDSSADAIAAAPDRYIVVFKRTPGAAVSRGRGAASVAASVAGSMQTAVGGAEVLRIYEHALDGALMKLSPAALAALRADSRVAYIEPDAVFRINDAQATPTWGLDRIDQRPLPVDQSYTYPTHAGEGVHAYVIDTGIYGAHEEFSLSGGGSRVVPGYDSIDNDAVPDDCQGHGTHVAGTIGGSTWGVAKKVTLHSVRVLDCSGNGTASSVIAGIDWVTANHVSPAVANMSLGGPFSQAVNDAVTNSIASGVTYGIAAGNSAADACAYSPASTPNAITVAASNITDSRASFSNTGTCVDLFAPGEQITSSWIGSPTATKINDGTSMATPHVVGATALWLSLHPSATPAEVATALLGRATPDLIQDRGTGTPNLLLYAGELTAADDTAAPSATITAPADGATVTDTATITASTTDDIGPVVVTQLFVNGVARVSDTQEPWSLSWDAHDLPAGTYQLVVKAIDAAGNIGASAPVSVTLAHAVAPASVAVSPASVSGGTSATGTVTLNQPAPAGGAVVTLASSNPAAATVDGTVSVAEGTTVATFPVATSAQTVTATVTISATIGAVTKTAALTVRAPVSVASVVLSPSSTQGGFSVSGFVSLTETAPSPVVVALVSDNAAAMVPATVTVPTGALSASFTVTTVAVSANTPATITATYPDGVSVGATLTVTPAPPPTVSSIFLNSSSVGGGISTSGFVLLVNNAPTGGAVVTMSSSNPAVASVPPTITVPAGSFLGSFTVTTTAVTSPVTVTLSASAPAGTTVTATLTVNPPQVSFVSLSPSTVNGGGSSTGTVSLAAPAPAGGAVVSLGSSDAAVAQVPASVTIPAGASSGTFSVTTAVVTTSTSSVISATYPAGRTVSATIFVNAPQVSFVSLSPSSVGGGASSTGTIFLTAPALAGGAIVSLASTNTAVAQVPATVTVPAGQSSATFSVTTVAVDTTTFVTISATFPAGRTVSTSLVVNAPQVSFVSLSPSTVNGGSPSTGTVTLNAPARDGGALVALSTTNASIALVPPTVTIPAGQTAATFPVTTFTVVTSSFVSIIATYPAGRTASASLLVNTVPVPVLSSIALSPTSVTGGASSTATATLSLPAPLGGAIVTLASNTPAATVPASVVVPEGQTKATFTVTTTSVAAVALVTISGSYPAATTRNATLTVNPPALTTFSVSPTSVPGGQGATGTVAIGVPAPEPGLTVSLTSNAPGVAAVPASVVIPAGATSATFPVTTGAPVNASTATLTAAGPFGSSKQAFLTVFGVPDVSGIFLSRPQVSGGNSATATIQLNQPAPTNVTLTLSSDSLAATVPATVAVPPGVQQVPFTITTTPVSSKVTATISATYPGRAPKGVALAIYPVLPLSVTLPAQVPAGETATAVVTLSGPAPTGGLTLLLNAFRLLNLFPPREQFNLPGRVPGSITVPQGETTASFPVTTLATDGFVLYLEANFDGPPPGGLLFQTTTTVTRTLPSGNAAYDTVLKAPRCNTVSAACDTGGLIDGRNFIGPEDHPPSTINTSCNDGASADETYYHRFESLDRLNVATLDGSALAAGKTVRVTATVWGFPNQRLMLFSAPDATNPAWAPIATLFTTGSGQQILTATFTLPAGSLQAIRGRFGDNASAPATPCTSVLFSFIDYDDLIFAADNGGPPTNIGPTVNAGPDQAITLPPVANLSGTVTDDGLPNPPGGVTTTWTKVSGPGNVTFGDSGARATTATFSLAGSYVLRLTASDGALSASDTVGIAVNVGTAPNQAPLVNAGPDQSVIIVPGTTTLAGTVTDDGAPNPPGVVTRSWSVVSGPGSVTFDDATALQPAVTFDAIGVYTLRLTADDGVLSASDDVAVAVLPVPNQAPTVNAGSDQVVTLPALANLIGAVQDDGLPAPPAVFITTWSLVGGPGTVTFGTPNQPLSTAAFSAAGTYTLRLTASDGELSASDDVVVTVNSPPNAAPVVNAGPDQTITLPAVANLAGTVTDDGLPNPPAAVTTTWTKVSGPGNVAFGNPSARATSATFAASGSYVLRLTASDGALSVNDTVAITVKPPTMKVQYHAAQAKPQDNHIKPYLDVFNTGTAPIPLNQIKVRYWYTIDSQQPQTVNCDFAQVGCSRLTSTFVTVTPARPGADRYLEIGFTAAAGSLAAGGHTGLIQLRWNKNNWSDYNETNDYSYSTGAATPAPTSFVDWSRVTIYQNGARVWGVEP